jgi:hypothetical protein
LRTRGVLLTLAGEGTLTAKAVESVSVSTPYELSASVREVSIPGGPSTTAGRDDTVVIPNAQTPVLVRGAHAAISATSMAVTRLSLQPHVPIEISTSGDANTTVTIRHGSPTSAMLRTADSFVVACDECELIQAPTQIVRRGPRFTMVRPFPREAKVQSTGAFTDIALVLPSDAASADFSVSSGLRVMSIDFTESGRNGLRSQIVDGTLRLADLNDRTLSLSRRDFLVLAPSTDPTEDLVLSELTLGREITLRLHGQASSVRSGADQRPHSRMPSLLEWIAANQPRALFVVSVAAVFGFLMAAAARLRIGQLE